MSRIRKHLEPVGYEGGVARYDVECAATRLHMSVTELEARIQTPDPTKLEALRARQAKSRADRARRERIIDRVGADAYVEIAKNNTGE